MSIFPALRTSPHPTGCILGRVGDGRSDMPARGRCSLTKDALFNSYRMLLSSEQEGVPAIIIV